MKTEQTDVVVVGAGLAGLVCARRLLQAGRRVVLLEADGRVGGRAHGTEAGGACFDLGGQWVGPGQERVLSLIDELGLATFPTANEGRHLLSAGGRLRTYRGTIPLPLSPRALLELGSATARTYGASWLLPADLRATARTARHDARSVEDLAGRLRTPEARALFDAAFRTVFGAEPRDVSLLYFLAYVRAGGGFFHLVDVKGGAQERRLVRGVYGIAAALAAPLGEVLRLQAPVRRIREDGGGVEVSGEGFAVHGGRAVVAVPPQQLARIAFDPPLPAERTALLQGCRMGGAVKVHALYARPFWRDRGLSGQAVCGEGPLSVLFDNSSHDGGQAALVGFVVGDEARRFGARDPAERRQALLDQLAHLFGREAAAPAGLLVHDWTQEAWTGGCPVASPPPGLFDGRAGALRAPHGRIHFAGTETAARYPGYLDGAVSSGERAAAEVQRGR